MSRILVVRLDGVGDAMVTLPLIAALRGGGHSVGVLLTTRNAECFNEGVLAARHVVERIPWPQHGSTPESRARALAEVKAERYDAALIASEEPEAYEYAKAAAIPARVGFWNGVERPLKSLWIAMQCTRLVHRPASLPRVPRHEVEQLYDLGEGFVNEATPPKDAARLRELIASRAPRSSTLVIQCTKKWLDVGCALEDLAAWFVRLRRGREVVLLAAEGEAAFAQDLAARTQLPLRLFASVRAWMETIAVSGMLLTPDTGAAHVGGMAGIPTVDVFAPEHFDQQSARWRPWASPFRALPAPAARDAAGFAAILGVALDSLAFALPA